jgi:cell division septation protein DedD
LYWKYDAIFPGRPEIKEVVNSSERDAVFKPQKPDRAEVKRREPELPASNVQEEKPNEKVIAPEPPSPAETEAGLVYQEGRYPYSVYLGSFDSTAQARSALDKYSKAGIDAFWVKVNLGEKGIWYRVYSGEFADKEGAEAFINEKAIKDGEIKKTAYAVYTGSFTDKEALLGMINILKQNDFSPYIISDENYDNLLVGAFLTKAGADELSTELTNLGISNSVVLR